MHEWSLAEAVIYSLLKFLDEEKLKSVEMVEISVGEILELEMDIFTNALYEIAKNTPLEGTKFEFKIEKALFKCNSCGYEWGFDVADSMLSDELGIVEEPAGTRESPLHFLPDLAQTLLKCPKCGSRDFDLISGKDIKVSKVVGVK